MSLNETELIQRLTQDLPADSSVLTGPGDDCAVLDWSGSKLLFKTDAIVEGIHFERDTPPEAIGRKALARALSDIAAMAGTPTHALITLGFHAEMEPSLIEAVYQGLRDCAREHHVNIVGGETTSLSQLTLSISLIGKASKPILRTGSAVGDAIFVSGELGGSLAGHHLNFTPRLKEARWLSDQDIVHAMIDLSDGLATDLRHLLSDQTGAELLTRALPIRRAAKERARDNPSGKTALLAALTDGEDYELLFTVSSKDAVPLLDGWKSAFPETPLHCIGKITDQPGIALRDDKGVKPLTLHGYDHLEQS
ncbi:MAG: thiamine-phosphate kinase [Pedosphaera sp.]|nr:thiamine-phosphate kinase [Pedosphaera sp.]